VTRRALLIALAILAVIVAAGLALRPTPPPVAAAGVHADCVLDRGDPYDPGARMPRGRYRGRCLDTSELRTLRLLTDAEAASHGLSVPRGWKAVANVRHADRFWIALIDPAAVADVVMQIENFPAIVPAAHTELRFRFAPERGALLVPQRPGDARDSVVLTDLVYTVEASYAIGGEPYDLVKGMRDFYGLVYRLTSLEERYQAMVVEQGHLVQQVRLDLSAEQGRDALVHALELGHAAGSGAMYHTLWRNCTTELYDVLDRSVEYGPRRRALKSTFFFVRTLPTLTRQGLRIRGLLDPSPRGEWPDLTREFETSGRARRDVPAQSSCNPGGAASSYASSPVSVVGRPLENLRSSAVSS
jgi:hypothetical protein